MELDCPPLARLKPVAPGEQNFGRDSCMQNPLTQNLVLRIAENIHPFAQKLFPSTFQ